MFTAISTIALISILVPIAGQSAGASLEVYDSKGRPRIGVAVRGEAPVDGDLTPKGTLKFERDVLLPDGRVARGIGLRAWYEGSKVRVRVVTLVPKVPSQDARYPWNRVDDYHVAELAYFLLDPGQSRRLDEMKSLGIDPMMVKLFPPGQHAH